MANTQDQVAGWYQQYLGRPLVNPGEATGWLNDPNAEANIKNSGEGQAYAAGGSWPTPTPTPQTGTPQAMTPTNTATPGYNYQQAQASWFGAAPGTSVDSWIAANPTFTQGITSGKGGEMMNLPGGQSFDAVRDFGPGGANAPQWGSSTMDYNTGAALTPAQSAAAEAAWASQHPSAGTAGAPSGTGSMDFSGSSSSSMSGQDAALRAQLIAQLTQRAQQGLAVSPTDPNIQQQVDPYRAEQDRASRTYLSQLAESAGQHYGASNLEGQARLANEKAGQNVGNFQATLIGKELDAKRTEIQQALTSMQGMLTQDQVMQLQMQLKQIEDATQRLGISTAATSAANNTALGFSNLDWATNPANPNNRLNG